MNTAASATPLNGIIVAVLAVIAVLLSIAVLAGINLPIVTNMRIAVIALGVIGLTMCTLGGIGPTVEAHGWTSLNTIVGAVLGIVALLLVGSALFEFKLPLIDSDRTAFLVLASLMLVKTIISVVPWDRFTA